MVYGLDGKATHNQAYPPKTCKASRAQNSRVCVDWTLSNAILSPSLAIASSWLIVFHWYVISSVHAWTASICNETKTTRNLTQLMIVLGNVHPEHKRHAELSMLAMSTHNFDTRHTDMVASCYVY